jgi:hypothetical protein
VTDPVARTPIRLTAVVDAAGTATITCDVVPNDYTWLLDYIVVSCSDPTAIGTYALYESGVGFSHFLDAVTNNRSVSPNQPARILNAGENLIAYCTGWTPGLTLALRVEYREQAGA